MAEDDGKVRVEKEAGGPQARARSSTAPPREKEREDSLCITAGTQAHD